MYKKVMGTNSASKRTLLHQWFTALGLIDPSYDGTLWSAAMVVDKAAGKKKPGPKGLCRGAVDCKSYLIQPSHMCECVSVCAAYANPSSGWRELCDQFWAPQPRGTDEVNYRKESAALKEDFLAKLGDQQEETALAEERARAAERQAWLM